MIIMLNFYFIKESFLEIGILAGFSLMLRLYDLALEYLTYLAKMAFCQNPVLSFKSSIPKQGKATYNVVYYIGRLRLRLLGIPLLSNIIRPGGVGLG
jgi:hypothetical protein